MNKCLICEKDLPLDITQIIITKGKHEHQSVCCSHEGSIELETLVNEVADTESGLRVFYDGDSSWYASPFTKGEFVRWFVKNVDNTLSKEELTFDECDLDNNGMWYKTTSPKDIESLGDYDGLYKGRTEEIGDLRRTPQRASIIEKLTSFREVIKLQGETREPYCIATTDY